ncbi:hypothetical protein HPB47_027085 [Ixodes persulcatus]|uniref:Uncharacterized protein n=1 Tax=Ixodes persulcatus TaxID=34615 RepID=A0AC60PXI8_IXOPE|nr:hypothetical protein HPB47_027085 [Ixodes persulcatus]
MDDDSWRPPTDAELKVLEARRERQDKISMIMGDYLLRGYKMLGDICDVCSTILLEDRQSNKYCIACSEVDTSENLKDNPVLSDAAAQRLVEELEANSEPQSREPQATGLTPLVPDRDRYVPRGDPSSGDTHASSVAGLPVFQSDNNAAPADSCLDATTAQRVVRDKLEWATRELRTCSSVDLSIQMCNLVKSCAEALLALRNLGLDGESASRDTSAPTSWRNLRPF